MKRTNIALLSCLAVLSVAACKPEAEAPAAEFKAGTVSVADDGRFSIAGIDDEQSVSDFLTALKESAAASDAQKLASLCQYPFKQYRSGNVTKEFANAEELAANVDTVFPAEVKQAIADATYEDLFVNYKGIMIHHGEVWIGLDNDALKVLATNPKE